MNEDNNFECESCGINGLNFKKYEIRYLGVKKGDAYLCDLCSNSHAGRAVTQGATLCNNDLAKIICYVGNRILGK